MFCFPVLRFVMFSRIYINCSTAIASNDWTSACHWAQHPLPTVLCDKRMNFVASVTSVQMKSWWSITVLVTDYKFSYSNIRPSVGSRYSAVQASVSSKQQCHSCRLLSMNTIRIIYSRVQRTSTELHGIRHNKSISRSFSQWSLFIERWERESVSRLSSFKIVTLQETNDCEIDTYVTKILTNSKFSVGGFFVDCNDADWISCININKILLRIEHISSSIVPQKFAMHVWILSGLFPTSEVRKK